MKYTTSFRNILAASLLVIFAIPAQAQFGISGAYRLSQDDFITSTNVNGGSFGNGYEVALDYWFRLKKKRIEFLPTISYANYSGTDQIDAVADLFNDVKFNINEFGFQLKTNFYLFDFGEDCDCPTWGKQGPAFHKGFFLQLAPGYSFFQSKASNENVLFTEKASNNQSLLSVSAGAGIDIGINNLITITPQFGYRYYFGKYDWTETTKVTPLSTSNKREANISNLYAGIRLGIRLDGKKY